MQGRDYIPCDIAEYHLLDVAELPPKDKNRALCDMRSFLPSFLPS
ncbi:Sel1 domain-containing protein [Yersinia pseudotuberculosis]|nr:Sel1 domain-containing protein [Yersinia pseudotuberculosis]